MSAYCSLGEGIAARSAAKGRVDTLVEIVARYMAKSGRDVDDALDLFEIRGDERQAVLERIKCATVTA